MADFDPVAKERLRERVRAEAEAEYARAMEMRRKKIAELDRLREQQGQAAGDRIAEALALLESSDWTDTRGLLYGGDLYRLSGSFRGQARSQIGKDPVEIARLMDASARASWKPADIIEEAAEEHLELFEPTDDISEKQSLEAALAQKAEELAIATARIAELEARVEAPAAVEWPDMNDKLSDWDEVGHGAIASNIPAGIAELMEPGETLTHDVRRKLTERLNVELAELKNLRGMAGEDLKREAEIEKLLGLFARLGEI